ncbi:MAG TPA: alpha/beta hydrolase [Acidimicrobiales bacterium]
MSPAHRLAVTEHLPSSSGADEPVLVMVHGSLDRSASFARVLRRLDDLHTVVYDRRGYHRSRDALPINTTIDGHIDDLLAVIDDRPSVVVGHSYGGDIALGAALRDGGSPSILSLAAYEPPLPWLGEWSRRPGFAATSRPQTSTTGPEAHGGAEAAAERFFRRMVGDAAWDRLPEEGKAARRADGPALAAELDAIRVTEAPFDVSALAIPAVFACGGISLPHHRSAVAWLVEHTPGAVLVEIPGAGHGAHLTHPDAFAGLARAALSRVGRRAGTTP